MARAEKYARSLIPGYSCLAESKHALKEKPIKSSGGSMLESPSNHWMVPTRRIAESMASGSVMFRRTQQTQRALSASRLRMLSRSRTRTRSPGPFGDTIWWWCASSTVIGSRTPRLNLRIPWTSLCFELQNARSIRRSRMMAWCPTFMARLRMPDMTQEREISRGCVKSWTRWDAETSPWRTSTQVA